MPTALAFNPREATILSNNLLTVLSKKSSVLASGESRVATDDMKLLKVFRHETEQTCMQDFLEV